MSTASMNQSADSTACTRLLMVFNYYSWYCVNANQLPTTTLSTCMHIKIHAFNVPLQEFLCQLQFLDFTPLCYEQQKRFNLHRYSPSALSVLWY